MCNSQVKSYKETLNQALARLDIVKEDPVTGRSGYMLERNGHSFGLCDSAKGWRVVHAFDAQLLNAPRALTEEVIEAWEGSNNDGNGFSVGRASQCCEAATEDDGMLIIDVGEQDEILAIDKEGRTVVICDLHGPWGCYVD